MANCAHNTPRRDFLKGMIVTSALLPAAAKAARHAAPTNHTQQAWNRALADYQAKRAYFDNHLHDDDAGTVSYYAARKLIQTPAPDGAALRIKLDLYEEYYADYCGLDEILPFLRQDALVWAGGQA